VRRRNRKQTSLIIGFPFDLKGKRTTMPVDPLDILWRAFCLRQDRPLAWRDRVRGIRRDVTRI
jgi:hypothetical protein